ncbi:MAG TPA: hypothetical protein VGT61_05005 [Thermomicrobiales bacterium]|jgi:hypothetical protein|nr:hypothetical protein [Thermomicrobiales bacterium]
MLDDVIRILVERYGDSWTADEDANIRFSIEAEFLLRAVEGAHLMGDPSLQDGVTTLTVWVDFPLTDLMVTDELAFEILGRLSEDVFYSERVIEARTIRYRFVTGTTKHGHVGALVFAGPHAAAFASAVFQRTANGSRFQA